MKKICLLVAGVFATFTVSASLHAQTTINYDPAKTGTGPSDNFGTPPTTGSATYTSTWNTTTADWYNGSADVAWPNSTSDIAVFGSSATVGTVQAVGTVDTTHYAVTVSGTVNAGGINFNYGSQGSGTGYGLTGASNSVIMGNSGSVFTIANAAAFFNYAQLANLTFKGAQSYQFTGGTGSGAVAQNQGEAIQGTTSFDQNVVLGTGSDYGTVALQENQITTSSTGTLTVNNGWAIYDNPGGASNITQNLVLNGLGQKGFATIGFGPATTGTISGKITLGGLADVSIEAKGSGGRVNTVSSNIGGTGNLYLGYSNTGDTSGEAFIISGQDTYSGQTIIFTSGGGDPTTANGGTTAEAVQLGATNVLPTTTTLVLGLTNNQNTVDGAGTITNIIAETNGNQLLGGNAGTGADGAFDLHGFSQTVAGLATGAGRTASNNFIGNNSGSGTSILTINGTGTSASGFGGIIEDNFSGQNTLTGALGGKAGGKVAVAVTGGGAVTLTGANTYSGGTAVSGSGTSTKGFLYADSASGSATGSGTVAVNGTSLTSYGTLGGGSFNLISNGTIGSGIKGKVYSSTNKVVTGAVTVNPFGHIAPGDASGSTMVGTLEVGALTLAAGAQADFDFNSTANDFIQADGLLTLGNNIVFNLNFIGVSNEAGTYDMIGYIPTSQSGAGDSGFSASDFSVTGLGTGLSATFSDDTADGVILMTISPSSTPEPSTWAMLLGGVALLGFVIRRRSFHS